MKGVGFMIAWSDFDLKGSGLLFFYESSILRACDEQRT
jgi:hypothetical protein